MTKPRCKELDGTVRTAARSFGTISVDGFGKTAPVFFVSFVYMGSERAKSFSFIHSPES